MRKMQIALSALLLMFIGFGAYLSGRAWETHAHI